MTIEELSTGKCWMFTLEIDGKNLEFLCFKRKDQPFIEVDFDGNGYGMEWRASVKNLDDMTELVNEIKEKVHVLSASGLMSKGREVHENKNLN